MDTLHIYIRVSSQVQVENTSLKTQKEVGIQLAEKLGFQFKIYSEGGSSGSVDNLDSRPVLSDIITRISLGEIKYLYSWNPDRLSRNQIVWIQIRSYLIRYGVILYTSNGEYDSSDYLQNLLLGVVSEITNYDNSLRVRRFRDARISRIGAGKFHGGSPLFGYSINKTSQGSTLVENKEESKWVRFMFESYVNKNWSTRDIKEHLEENNVKTRRNKSYWSLGTLQSMLRNQSYLGEMSFFEKKSQKTYHYKIPQIISHNLFERVQEKRIGILNVKGQYRRTKKSYLFREFMVCSCGHRIGVRNSKKSYVQNFYCPQSERLFNQSVPTTDLSCTMKRCLNIPQTEEFLWDSIVGVLEDTVSIKKKLKEHLSSQGRLNGDQLKRFITRQKGELRKLVELKSRVEDGIIDVERKNYLGEHPSEKVYKSLRKQLNRKHLSISSKIESIQSTISSVGNEHSWFDFIDRMNELLDKNNITSQPVKKKVLRTIIDQIKVSYDGVNKTHGLEVNFRIPMVVQRQVSGSKPKTPHCTYSTVTDLAKLRGWSTLHPRITAM